MKRDDINSLAHSKRNCKYHIVFAPKYRRMVIYSQIKTDIGKILRRLLLMMMGSSRLFTLLPQ